MYLSRIFYEQIRAAVSGIKLMACLLVDADELDGLDGNGQRAIIDRRYVKLPPSNRFFDGIATKHDARKYMIATCRAVIEMLEADVTADEDEPSTTHRRGS